MHGRRIRLVAMVSTLGVALVAPLMASGTLPPPFLAAQIRDEMTLGFEAVMRRTQGQEVVTERWKVIDWSEEDVVIESTPLGEDGSPAGEASSQRSTWLELESHAHFDPSITTREKVTRSTPLGVLEGWLYVVEAEGSTSRFFFATDLPGAPVLMTVEQDGVTVVKLEQLERSKSE